MKVVKAMKVMKAMKAVKALKACTTAAVLVLVWATTAACARVHCRMHVAPSAPGEAATFTHALTGFLRDVIKPENKPVRVDDMRATFVEGTGRIVSDTAKPPPELESRIAVPDMIWAGQSL